MTFEELRTSIRKIAAKEISAAVDYYLEVAVAASDKAVLEEQLQNYFGPPLKPAGLAATEECDRYAGRYGGVRSHQTLYVRKEGPGTALCLLWPWGGGGTVTVKLIRR